METRKVYVSGGSTYVISLPKKWVKKTDLKAGDSLVVTEQGGWLLVGACISEIKSATKEGRISQMMSADALERIIIALYLVGYDTIRVRLDRKDHLPYRKSIRKMLDYLIGIEILEDTNDSMTLEIMVDYRRMTTMAILQRMYSINRSMLLDLSKSLKTGDTGLAIDVMVREREIDRLYFLVVRQLKSAVEYPQVAEKLGIVHQRDCLGYRITVKVLEKIFMEFKDIRKAHTDLSGELLQPGNVQSAILQKTMLDSFGRIASYSGDIAEIAINMSADTLGNE